MSKHLAILTMPGIGTKKPGFDKKLRDDIRRYTQDEIPEADYTFFDCRPFNTSGIDQIQLQNYKRLVQNGSFGRKRRKWRELVYEAFGDAVIFERNRKEPSSNYLLLHQELKSAIEKIHVQMQQYDSWQLLFVVSSMGVHILSTYIWDADHGLGLFENVPATHHNNLRKLRYLATFGCNMPLFLSGLSEDEIVAFDRRNANFEWDNYYDKNDLLGYPLQPLSPSYRDLVADHQINVGITTLSHMKYWGHRHFTKNFSKKLIEIYREI